MTPANSPHYAPISTNQPYQVHKSFEDNFWSTKMALKVGML